MSTLLQQARLQEQYDQVSFYSQSTNAMYVLVPHEKIHSCNRNGLLFLAQERNEALLHKLDAVTSQFSTAEVRCFELKIPNATCCRDSCMS